MKCVVCGLDNDPAREYCAGCEYQLDEESATASPVARDRPATASRSENGPEYPAAGSGYRGRRAGPLSRPLLAAAAVLLVAAGAGAVMWTRDGAGEPAAAPTTTSVNEGPGDDGADPDGTDQGDPGASPDPAVALAQGTELDGLLAASKQSRDKLVRANGDVLACTAMSGAVQRLREVGDERDSQRARLANLDLSAIAQGEEMRAALDEALDHSLRADRHYVEWAEVRQENGCRNTAAARSHQEQGDQASHQAGTAKTLFLELWNPVAGELALPVRDRREI